MPLIALSQEAIQAGSQNIGHLVSLSNLLSSGGQSVFAVTMLALGLAGIPFSYLLYRSKLIPPALSLLGMIGYIALFVGSLLEITGINLNMVHFVPGGLFEFILPIWLFIKGFNQAALEQIDA